MKETEFTFLELQQIYAEFVERYSTKDFKLTKDDLMTDQEVAELFGISEKTLDRCRKKGEIKFFRLGSKNYYLRSLLFLDILKRYND
ncbi:helix-turn-helix domain-containing protein [Empedobacter sp. R132-2]|uniref:helix-turn-helix domain-containing protein n=1 Tax=Empedobacter sp. R132-2 TaxID=2746740 RepID=UPI00257816C8|nr:helix-turn-helix domain-containing protein [Empedobacter sp. R132-2]MDM1137626.1 helix-turn-helix domain-containing protein [Empedobacter sp. R132-2]